MTSVQLMRTPASAMDICPAETAGEFFEDMRRALAAAPHRLPPKYFYDEKGSALFDRICELPEYYPTRTELDLLARHAGDIAQRMGTRAEIVEFGAGSLRKIRLLLDALDRPARYLPIDISGEHLAACARRLKADYPDLALRPIVGDYTADIISWPVEEGFPPGRRYGFFPGSTLGNLDPPQALDFLRHARRLLRGGALLLGVDLIKQPAILHAAYNDSAGITAAFNLNVLARANRELGTDFDIGQFAHAAFYNAPLRRVEMHLISRRRQTISLGTECFSLDEGDTLHTECSYKYTVQGLQSMARQAGLQPTAAWVDTEKLFSLHWLEAPA
ncbi:L-histidine N(alpha)-methyltransferase [Pollutimonas sp. M17]|uniref:L-histidine N(alpha)-methyltransferase n=1 Tax=Pollutimonas sp. M17 TaxID=2962065 RepID=UPI00398EA8F3